MVAVQAPARAAASNRAAVLASTMAMYSLNREVDLAERGELADFAFGDDAAGAAENVEDAQVARLGHQREGARANRKSPTRMEAGCAPDVLGGGLAAGAGSLNHRPRRRAAERGGM